MSLYQQISVADGAPIGDPAELPAALRGLADESLADLSWADPSLGFAGVGFIPAIRTCSVYDLMYVRCTQDERMAIRASLDPKVVDFVQALKVVPRVELDGPLTIQGLAYMEAQGLIAPGRAAQIRA